jgi:hypothetical protein
MEALNPKRFSKSRCVDSALVFGELQEAGKKAEARRPNRVPAKCAIYNMKHAGSRKARPQGLWGEKVRRTSDFHLLG